MNKTVWARLSWLVITAFMLMQVWIILFASNGPVTDEGSTILAGLQIWRDVKWSGYYLTWFTGSPFLWSPLAALGFSAAGLEGARLMALGFMALALLMLNWATRLLWDETVAFWTTLALSLNGLFISLAHLAVYDSLAFAALGLGWWGVARFNRTEKFIWLIGAGLSLAVATLAKYPYGVMGFVLAGLLWTLRREKPALRSELWVFGVAAASPVLLYALFFREGLSDYLRYALQANKFVYTREMIAWVSSIYISVPLCLAVCGLYTLWSQGKKLLGGLLFGALWVWPLYHLVTATYISLEKHLAPSFFFASPLMGVALARLWEGRWRALSPLLVAGLFLWGWWQWQVRDASWLDIRPAAKYLQGHIKPGERVIAPNAWAYALYLYPDYVSKPQDIYDEYGVSQNNFHLCDAEWLVYTNNDLAASAFSEDLKLNAYTCSYSTPFTFYTYPTRLLDGWPLTSKLGALEVFQRNSYQPVVGTSWQEREGSSVRHFEGMSVVFDGKLYVFGGEYFTTKSQKTISVYDPKLNHWQQIGDLPDARSHAGVAVEDHIVYMAGGLHGVTTVATVWKYDLQRNVWSDLPPLPQPRFGGALVLLNQRLHFIGGGVYYEGSTYLQDKDDHWVLDLSVPNALWIRAAPLPNPRNHLAYAVMQNKIYVIGGQHNIDEFTGNQTTVNVYDSSTDTWSAAASLLQPLSHISSSLLVRNDRLVIAGGLTQGRESVNDIIEYDPFVNRWRIIGQTPLPRYSNITAIIDKQLVLVQSVGTSMKVWRSTEPCLVNGC